MPENESGRPEDTIGTEAGDDRGANALLDEEEAEDLLDAALVTTFEGEPEDEAAVDGELALADDDDDLDDDELDDDLDADLLDDQLAAGAPIGAAEVGAGAGAAALAGGSAEQRLRRLEAAAGLLADAEVTRESKRVRRKVSAATTGAGAIGFIPILLQLAGALDLSPELAAAVSTIAASVGAFAAGWVTPERKPPLPTPAAQALLALGGRSDRT